MMKRLVLILVFFSVVLFAEAQTQITDISHIRFIVLAGDLDTLLRSQPGVRCTLDQNSINKLDKEVKSVFGRRIIHPGEFFTAGCTGIESLNGGLRFSVSVFVYIQFTDYGNNWVYWAYYRH
jgi:hypothetical protein